MPLIALSLIASEDALLTMPLLTEISPQTSVQNNDNFNHQTTPEVSKNNDDKECPKFLELIYNKESWWGITTAKQQRTKKRKANLYIVTVDKTVEAIDQLLLDKTNAIDIEDSVKTSDNHNVTTNIYQNRDAIGNIVRDNEQDIPESKEQQNGYIRLEIPSIDIVDANERYQIINQSKTVNNKTTIQVVNIKRLQRQTIQVENPVSILPAKSSNTTTSLDLEEIFPEDVEMTDLDSTNVFNTPNLKVNNNILQSNSAVDLDRYCFGCKRKLALENNTVEMPNAKRPRMEQPVQSNTYANIETSNRIEKPWSASPISTIVSRNISPNPNNVLVPVINTSSEYRNMHRPNNSSNAKSYNPDLNVEITTANRRNLSFQQTLFIKDELTTMILQMTDNLEHSSDIFIPRFVGKPVQAKGCLRLWCKDTCSLIWLKNSIKLLPMPGLVVKRQCDKYIRIQFIKAGIFIPRIYYEKNQIILVLKRMNPWAAVETWPIEGAKKCGDYVLFTVGIPFEIIGEIFCRDHVMQFVMGTVRVRYFKGKELIEIPHDIINGRRARALHTRWRQQRFPVQNWASRLPPHQVDF